MADTSANAAASGRPGTSRGQGVSALPQVRLVGLAECGTDAITKVAVGPCTTAETWRQLSSAHKTNGRGEPEEILKAGDENLAIHRRRLLLKLLGGERPAQDKWLYA